MLHREPAPSPMPGLLQGLAWLAGVALHLQQRVLWAPWRSGALAVAAVLAWLLVRGVFAATRSTRSGWRTMGLCVAVASLAFAMSNWRADDRLDQRLPEGVEGEDVVVTGVVASLPQSSADGVRFRFDAEVATWLGEPVRLPEALWVGWYANESDSQSLHASGGLPGLSGDLRAGQRWRLTLRLRQPHGVFNPHGFDRELWLFEQGVRATASVRTSGGAPPRLLASGVGHRIDRWRQAIRDRIRAHVDDRRAAGVLAALAVGDQGAIDSDDWDVFRATGVSHLVSISGFHVTMFAWLAQWLVSLSWRRGRRLVLLWPAPVAGHFLGLLAATGYALFSGWGVPAQRTVWMLVTAFVLHGLSRRWPWPRVLLAAAVVVSAIDPWALLQPGFWLSFMAVGLLMSSGDAGQFVDAPKLDAAAGGDRPTRRWRRRMAHAMAAGLRAQLIATVGLAPLAIVFFHQLSLVGFVANLVAIPVVTLLVTPLALLGTAVPGLWAVAASILSGFHAFLALLASTPNALWSAPVAPLYAQIAGLAAGLLLVARLPWRLRLLAVPLALPLLWPAVDRPERGRFDVLAADVGQGTAVLVRTHDHVLLYDAGPKFGVDSDAGQRILLPLLQAMGETHLDAMVVSHRDLDHVGGAAAIAEGVQVDELLSSLEDDHPLLGKLPVHDRCEAGQSWTWDDVSFEMLRPRESDYDIGLKPNALSCVLKVTDHGRPSRSLLLTGDMERAQEEQLLQSQPDTLATDVLVAPHHGSRTSSTAAFLDATHAKVAVFQAAYRSRFGHPAPDVLQRYKDRRIAIVTSAECGAWRWASASAALSAEVGEERGVCERDRSGRYWNFAVHE